MHSVVVLTKRAMVRCPYGPLNLLVSHPTSQLLWAEFYDLPAWGGFLTYELTAKIDSFLRKAVRWGFSSHYKCLTDLLREADLHLFRKMTSNSGHCIHQLLAPTKVLPMKLRDSHCVFALPQCHYNLYKHYFVLRNLFVSAYLMDVRWYCIFLVLISLLMLCYAFNLLMAFDRLLLKGLLTYFYLLKNVVR